MLRFLINNGNGDMIQHIEEIDKKFSLGKHKIVSIWDEESYSRTVNGIVQYILPEWDVHRNESIQNIWLSTNRSLSDNLFER